MKDNDPNIHYHNNDYGFPIQDDNELFGRLLLEINQAGLSWTTILKKADNFRRAYSNFDIGLVAKYDDTERERLLSDSSIIRNRLKIDAAIYNAKVILEIQKSSGSFSNWLDQHISLNKQEWVKLFKSKFRFTGGEITNEFLLSTSYLKGAHTENCPIFKKVIESSPKWQNS